MTFEDVTRDLIRDYEVNGKRSLGKAKKSVERLVSFFGGWRAVQITMTIFGAAVIIGFFMRVRFHLHRAKLRDIDYYYNPII